MCPPCFKTGLPRWGRLLVQAAVWALAAELGVEPDYVIVLYAEVEAGILDGLLDAVDQLYSSIGSAWGYLRVEAAEVSGRLGAAPLCGSS